MDRCCPTDPVSPLVTLFNGPMSPSAYHSGTNTYVGRNGVAHTLDASGDVAYDTDAPYENDYGGAVQIRSSSVVRDHGGMHWYFVFSAWETKTGFSEYDRDPEDPHDTGMFELSLHQIDAAGGPGSIRRSLTVIADEGYVHTGFTSSVFGNVWPRGLDWSPFEDCIYLLVDTQDSGHIEVSNSAAPNVITKLLRVRFDGTYDEVWSVDTGSAQGGSGGLAVASDGAVWFKTYDVPGVTFLDCSLWRMPYEDDTPVVVPLPYSVDDSAPAATNWGAVLVWRNHFESGAVNTYPFLVESDGSADYFFCDTVALTSMNTVWSAMRSEDFSHLYLAGRSQIYELDWIGCCSGWYVGVIGFGAPPPTL